MKYFVVSIQKVGETNPCSIFSYDTKEQACSAYHSTLASNYVSETLDAFSVVLLNEHGATEMKEFWEKPVDESQEIISEE